MKSRIIKFYILLSVPWFTFSCSLVSHHSGYDANPVFAPFHEKAGEIKASAGYGRVLGIQSNISYSVTNRFAIMAGGVYNHQTIATIGIFNPIYFKLKNHYIEGAIGYYFPVNGKALTQVEIYAGLGSGIISKKTGFKRSFSSSYSEFKGNYQKPFLLITAKKPISGDYELGFGNRLSYIQFPEFNYSSYGDSANYTNASTLVTEPVLIFNKGKRLKFTSQCGLAIPLTKAFTTVSGTSYSNASILFQLGFKYNIR